MSLEPLAIPVIEAARYIGVGRRTLYRLLNAGSITAHKHGRQTLVDTASLRAYHAARPAYGPKTKLADIGKVAEARS